MFQGVNPFETSKDLDGLPSKGMGRKAAEGVVFAQAPPCSHAHVPPRDPRRRARRCPFKHPSPPMSAAPFPDPRPPRPTVPCPQEAPAWLDTLAAARWSPYVYSNGPVDDATLRALFGAAVLAPSAANEQPWRFVVGRKGDPTYDAILGVLTEPNQAWARYAPVLGLAFHVTTRANGTPLHTARRDTGAAMALLALAATSRGLQVHQMAGFDPVAARMAFAVPEHVDADVAFALGAPGDAPPPDFPEHFAARDAARRGRNPLADVLFGGAWEEALLGNAGE